MCGVLISEADNSVLTNTSICEGAALQRNDKLDELRVDGVSIGDAGAESVLDALKINTRLRRLYMAGCDAGDCAMQTLGETLKRKPKFDGDDERSVLRLLREHSPRGYSQLQ